MDYEPESLYLPIIVKFGETKNETERKLSSIFGYSNSTNREFLTFNDVCFADIKWNSVICHFLYDSNTNHFDGMMFVKKFETVDMEKKFRDTLAYRDMGKYSFSYSIKDDGFKQYVHKDSLGNLIFINVEKQNNKYEVLLSYYSGVYRSSKMERV